MKEREASPKKGNMTGKTTKADLIEAIHTGGNLNRKEVHGLIDALFDKIKCAILAGTFEVKKRKGRKRARNPKTGEIVAGEDHGVAAFRPGRELDISWHKRTQAVG